MPLILTQPRLDILAEHVAAGDRIAYYSQLADWGYQYGALALGVVSNDQLTGAIANEFFVNEAGVILSANQLASQSLALMQADFNARSALNSVNRQDRVHDRRRLAPLHQYECGAAIRR